MQIKKYYEFVNESINELSAIQLKFLKDSVKGKWTQNSQGFIDVTGSVDCYELFEDNKTIKEIPVKFGKVSKDFSLYSCNALSSLKGSPNIVGGEFNCIGTSIITLEGAPVNVGKDFFSSNCTKLISLKGAPYKINGDFSCGSCELLTTLDYSPKKINGYYYCGDCISLTTLVGAQGTFKKEFQITGDHSFHKDFSKLNNNEKRLINVPDLLTKWLKSDISIEKFIEMHRGAVIGYDYNI